MAVFSGKDKRGWYIEAINHELKPNLRICDKE